MALKRIAVTLEFNGPSPLIINSNGTFDKRTSLVNLSRLIRGIDKGAQFRGTAVAPQVTVNQSVVQATGTVTPALPLAADTVSVGGQALTATQGRATGTVTFATAIAGNTVTINGVLFTAVNGAVTPGQATFDISGGNTTGAASLVAQLAAYAGASSNLLVGVVSSRSAAAVMTLFAVNEGTLGNAITLASSGGTLAVSGALLTGGAALANNQWDPVGSNVTSGASLARCINNSTTAAVKQVSAVANATTGVVTLTAKAPGAAGNAVALASSNGGRLAVSGATLTGGTQGASTVWTF